MTVGCFQKQRDLVTFGFSNLYHCYKNVIKASISKFQFDQDRGTVWKPAKADMASSLNIVICIGNRMNANIFPIRKDLSETIENKLKLELC